jgi:peptide/nickel transport system substrate-binding protein
LNHPAIAPSVSVRSSWRVPIRWTALGVLSLLFVAGVVASCSPSPQAKPSSGPSTLRIGIASNAQGAGVRSFLSTFLFDSLVGIGWDGRPIKRVISGWQLSENQLELHLQLRPHLQFHDGTPIELPFFKTSLETLLRKRQGGMNVSFSSVVGVEIAENNDVVIKLSRPEAFLLTDLANLSLTHPTNPDIGLGPYRLMERSEQKTRLAAFDKYYQGRPNIDFLEAEAFQEQRGSWAALMRGQIDAVHEITPGAMQFVEAEGQTRVHTFPFTRPYYFQLVFNVHHPILKNPAVRQALSYGIDRQAVIDSGFNGQGSVAEGPIWPYHWAYSGAPKTYTHNVEAATLRLDSAGLRITSTAGHMPSRLRIKCLTVAKDQRYEKIALVIQKQLYEIGVDMAIETLPGGEVVKRLESGDFDTILIERTSGRSLAWTYAAFHSSMSKLGYTAADNVLDVMRTTTDEAKIRSAVSDLQQVFFENPPAIFIAWPRVARVVSNKFVVPEEKGRDVMSSLWQWRPAEPTR